MLCGERRDAPVWNKRGNALSIAKQVYEYETGESGEKKPRHHHHTRMMKRQN